MGRLHEYHYYNHGHFEYLHKCVCTVLFSSEYIYEL